jgi:hypothetical protein
MGCSKTRTWNKETQMPVTEEIVQKDFEVEIQARIDAERARLRAEAGLARMREFKKPVDRMDYHHHAVLIRRGREALARSVVEGRLSPRSATAARRLSRQSAGKWVRRYRDAGVQGWKTDLRDPAGLRAAPRQSWSSASSSCVASAGPASGSRRPPV